MIVNEKSPQTDREFNHIGHYLSTLLPRCSDSNLTIRQTAAENIQALLCKLIENSTKINKLIEK